jgi:hypothetical protein
MGRKYLCLPALAAVLVLSSADLALAQATTAAPGVAAADTRGNDSFDWGWLGLLGLAGLAGLYRKNAPVHTTTSGSLR